MCHACLTLRILPSDQPPAPGLLPGMETQQIIGPDASYTPFSQLPPLLFSVTLSSSAVLSKEKGKGVAKPFFPGVKVGGEVLRPK